MKIALILSTVFFMANAGFSQQEHIINTSIEKLTGTWQWVSGTDTVTIFLKKEKILMGNFHSDQIVGYHKYKTGVHTIESSYNYISDPFTTYKSTILGQNTNDGDTLRCSLRDLSKNKPIRLTLILNSNQNTLTWHSYIGGIQINEISGITLPRDMVLIKQ